MTNPRLKARLATMALAAAALCAVPGAIAAEGDTSGPAAGKTTVPNTAAQKEASKDRGAAASTPGVEGKQGVQSGAAPAPAKSDSR
jgi:hypothetical protein